MPNNISLAQAINMTSLYRAERENILAEEYKNTDLLLTCETFDRQAFDDLLSQAGCEKIRIYFGMTEDFQVRAIVVGVNSADEDMLPGSQVSVTSQIVEDGLPCPNTCPPPSPLNED